jgi:hypothetical protein
LSFSRCEREKKRQAPTVLSPRTYEEGASSEERKWRVVAGEFSTKHAHTRRRGREESERGGEG